LIAESKARKTHEEKKILVTVVTFILAIGHFAKAKLAIHGDEITTPCFSKLFSSRSILSPSD
jgi:hypothetical protein